MQQKVFNFYQIYALGSPKGLFEFEKNTLTVFIEKRSWMELIASLDLLVS